MENRTLQLTASGTIHQLKETLKESLSTLERWENRTDHHWSVSSSGGGCDSMMDVTLTL